MKNKLLLFSKINFGNTQNQGYWAKVNSQADAIRKQGWNVDLLYVFNNEIRLKTTENIDSIKFSSRLGLLYYLFIKFPGKLNVGQYNGVYIRHFLTNPLFIMFLKRVKSKVNTIVMEIPTYPYSFEYKGFNKNRVLYLIDKACSFFFKNYIDRIVSFSFDKFIYNIPTILTDNGVDVSAVNFNPKPPIFETELRILGLGNPRIWHAYERVIMGLNDYYKTPHSIKVKFEIVGQGGEIDKYIQLAEMYNLKDKIVFHGYKTGQALDAICNECHIAVASMGMHRINVANGEASPLKAREFAARGIPFISGYLDKGFPKDFPFIINFPSDESPVDIDKVLNFYTSLLNSYPDYPEQLRKYAFAHLDWSSKMKPIVDYLNQSGNTI